MTAPNLLEAIVAQLVELYGAEHVAAVLGPHLDQLARERTVIGWEVLAALGAMSGHPAAALPPGWRISIAKIEDPEELRP